MIQDVEKRVEMATKGLAVCMNNRTNGCKGCPYNCLNGENCRAHLYKDAKELIEYFSSQTPRKPIISCPVCNTELKKNTTNCPECGQSIRW